MDYVSPVCIKIYRYADTSLLLDAPNRERVNFHYESPSNAIKYSAKEETDIGVHLPEKGLCVHAESYYLKDNRYLFENIPWTYPVRFYYYMDCQKIDKDMLEYRKNCYADEANGYALIRCLTINIDDL
jgi:hypothetical protein